MLSVKISLASPSPQTRGHAYKLYKERYCNLQKEL